VQNYSRRCFLKLLGGAGLACSMGDLSYCMQAPRPKPNVLFIAVDDLKPLLGCYGRARVKSPNIDRLASSGMVFLNGHCQQAVCGPSRASLLTGLRPDTTEVWDLKTRMRDIIPDILTLPQHFKNNRYRVEGMGKIFDGRCCDGWGSQDRRSWSVPFIAVGGKFYADEGKSSSKPSSKDRSKANRPSTECADVPDSVYQDGQLAIEGSKAIRRLVRKNTPFFLAVGFKKPHLPFTAPKKYWDMYERSEFELPEYQKQSKDGPDIAYHTSGELRSGYTDIPLRGPITRDKQLELIHGYHACVSFVDAQIGRLLDELRVQGAEDNTIVVLWGDHGWHLGDHNLWCKHTNFEQATRSAFVIRAPGTKGVGGKTNAPAEFVDIFPTLCDLAKLPIPPQLEGASLVPVLNDPQASVKDVAISQYPRSSNGKPVMGYAYRSERYRYIEWIRKDYRKGQKHGAVVSRELYDYEKDPMETTNAVDLPEYREVVRKFERISKG